MLEISKYQNEYDRILDGIVKKDDIRLFCVSDICGDMLGGTTFIAVTDEKIIIVGGNFTLEKNQNKFSKIKAPTRVFTEFYRNQIPLDKITELRFEEMISTARLIAVCGEEKHVITFGTFAVKTDMLLFKKYLERFLENHDTACDEEDFGKDMFCPKCGKRYTNPSTKKCIYCETSLSLVKKFWIFIKKYWVRFVVMFALLLLASGIGVISPYFSSTFFYDKVLTPGNDFYGKILLIVMIVAGINVLEIIINMFSKIISAKVTGSLIYDLKVTIFSAIDRLSLDFFTGRQTGGLMTQVNDDSNSIYWFFTDGLSYYILNIAKIIVISIIMFSMQPLLAAICIAVMPLFFWLSVKTLRKEHYYHFKRHSAVRGFRSYLTDAFAAIKVTKAFAMEKEECVEFGKQTEIMAESSRKITIFRHLAPPLLRTIMYMSTLFVWGLGGWLTLTGKMTYGFFTAFVAYVNMINSPLYSLADMMDSLADCVNSMRRLFEIYDADPSVVEAENPDPKDTIDGSVEFRNVTFSYDKNRKIIDNVSFKVEAGSSLGIVGHSGAGKSTLANLLIRLYDADSGSILIDGIDVKNLKQQVLHENVSIVSQETYIFSGTIFDNIAYAKKDATREEVIDAARRAGAHDFIIKMEDGYQTKVGLGYKGLSGGEKQRISIARAILKRPKILILDEATASMDTKTERMIQISLDELTKGRTTITIAHRLSTLKNVNHLIVIENGKLLEEGTSQELLKNDGVYRRLYTLQIAAMKNILEEQ